MKSRLGVVLLTAALLTAACGGDDDGEADAPGSTSTTAATGGETTTTAAPVDEEGCTEERKGGELTMIPSSVINPLDPITMLGASRGYLEAMAVYDTLLYRDADTGEFVPQLAESLEPNDDFSVWTMTLREGVTYGNGDTMVADDVRFNVERMAASPRVAAGMANRIESMEVVDDLTIVFTLKAPWTNLPYYFAHGGGLVANPRLVEERGEDFGTNATGAGAGPYEVASFAPDEGVVLEAKDDYWGGPVCIETLRFEANPTAAAVLDAFRTGEIDAFFINEQRVITEAKDEGVTGRGLIFGSQGMHVNSGRGENPIMADLRLRQAVAYAIDPEVLDTRVWDGRGLPETGVTHPDQLIYSGVEGPPYDEDAARALVEEVKAETGWDGTVRLTCTTSPENIEYSIAVEAMLNLVGFQVQAENLAPAEHSTKVLTEGNYDLACGNAVTFDEAPERGLGQFVTGSPQNRTGFGHPDLDAAIARLDTADGAEEVAEVMAEVQEVWNEHLPSVWTHAGEWFIGWDDDIQGLKQSIASVILFDDAWIES